MADLPMPLPDATWREAFRRRLRMVQPARPRPPLAAHDGSVCDLVERDHAPTDAGSHGETVL